MSSTLAGLAAVLAALLVCLVAFVFGIWAILYSHKLESRDKDDKGGSA